MFNFSRLCPGLLARSLRSRRRLLFENLALRQPRDSRTLAPHWVSGSRGLEVTEGSGMWGKNWSPVANRQIAQETDAQG